MKILNNKTGVERSAYAQAAYYIDNSDPLHDWDVAKSQGWVDPSGNGTAGNPYIIEGLNINIATGNGAGIHIKNSQGLAFIIRDSNITAPSGVWREAGIKLENTWNGTITNVHCYYYLTYGIYLTTNCRGNVIAGNMLNDNILSGVFMNVSCYENVIANNTIYETPSFGPDQDWGIEFADFCFNNSIVHNLIYNHCHSGIKLARYCSMNTIKDNQVNGNGATGAGAADNSGIYLLDECCNNTIQNNSAYNNNYAGVLLDRCHNTTVVGNKLHGNEWRGLEGAHSHSNIVINNTIYDVAGEKTQDHGIWIPGCSDSYIGNNIIYGNYYHGIDITYSCTNNMIDSNTIYGHTSASYSSGIFIGKSTVYQNHIQDNHIYNNLNGISLTESTCNNTVEGNHVHDNSNVGITMLHSAYLNTITGNIVEHNGGYNIYMFNVSENKIYQNQVKTSTSSGIVMNTGLRNLISENEVIGNVIYGIWVYSSNENRILNNVINYNSAYKGIMCTDDSVNNIIAGNEFSRQNLGTPWYDIAQGTVNYPSNQFLLGWTYDDNLVQAAPSVGYYPGSEGFEQIIDGNFLPINWTETGTGNGSSTGIIPSKQDSSNKTHNKVFHAYTGTYNGVELPGVEIHAPFSGEQGSGTCEFWLCMNTSGPGITRFELVNAVNNVTVSITIENGIITYMNGITPVDTGFPIMNDTWYLISLDFSSDGSYAGLGANQYRFRVSDLDGAEPAYLSPVAAFMDNGACKGLIINATADITATIDLYIDAVGYSWDAGYTVGDNMVSGIFLEYLYQEWATSATVYMLDSVWYTLDGSDSPIYKVNGTSFKPAWIFPRFQDNAYHWLTLKGKYKQTGQVIQSRLYGLKMMGNNIYIINQTENGDILITDNDVTGVGVIGLSPTTDLDIGVSFNATINQGMTKSWTNASIYFKVSQGAWEGPFNMGYDYGSLNVNFTINEGHYEQFDEIFYYFAFQQYDNNSQFIDNQYWTLKGLKVTEKEAREDSFAKRISPIPWKLTLNYSVWYEAEITASIPLSQGGNIIEHPWFKIAWENLTVDFYNLTENQVNFSMVCDEEPSLDHTFDLNSGNISRLSQFMYSQGIMCPFVLPLDLNWTIYDSKIWMPGILYDGVDESRNLNYTGDLVELTYSGDHTWPFQGREVLKFLGTDMEVYYEKRTGIMVYYEWFTGPVNASHRITFGLTDNNQTYPINLQVEKRLEAIDEGTLIIPSELFMIIYDPPGDHSYSQVTAGTTVTKGYSFDFSVGGGAFFEAEMLGCGVGAGVDMSASVTTSTANSFEMAYTYEKTLTSSTESDDPALIGPGRGDLYYGTAIIIHYFVMVNNYYIIVNGPDNPGYNLDDIKVWEEGSHIQHDFVINSSFSILGAYLDQYGVSQLETYNIFSDNYVSPSEAPHVKRIPDSPLFWTPGYTTEILYSQTTTTTQTQTLSFEMSLEAYLCWHQEIGISAGAFVSVSGIVFETSGRIGISFGFSETSIQTSATESNRQIICHLEDDDGTPVGLNDQFQVDIFSDLRFNTFGYIVFEENTYTSNPFEYGTNDRRAPVICDLRGMGDYISNVVQVQCVAEDHETGIYWVKFFIDDDPYYNIDSTFIGYQDNATGLGLNVFEISWDTYGYNGMYYLFAVAFDCQPMVPNYRVSSPLEIQVDNVAPTTCKPMGYEPYSGPIRLYARAQDAGSGIEYVEYWDGVPGVINSTRIGMSNDISNAYQLVWLTDPGGADDGIHHIYARAYDRAGNYLESTALEIFVQNVVPDNPALLSPEETTAAIVAGSTGGLLGLVASLVAKPISTLIEKFRLKRKTGKKARELKT